MKKSLIAASIALASASAYAEGDYKPFVMFDFGMEKDERHDDIVNEYLNANVTVGVKTANKVEYSIKSGVSQSESSNTGKQQISNNIEFKVKKSYALTDWASPYVSLRLGEKIKSNGNHFTHYSVDAGVKLKIDNNLAFDTGLRYRNALSNSRFRSAEGLDPAADPAQNYSYESVRLHGMFLYDLDKANTLGLRYTKSVADYYKEERDGWRLHYQHNY